MSRIEESISKLKRFKYHAIGRLELEDAIDNVVSWYEQMMKEAVEGKVFMSFAPGHNQMVMADVDFPTNTKVKLIIVKEDDRPRD